jgi:hypothetical protein
MTVYAVQGFAGPGQSLLQGQGWPRQLYASSNQVVSGDDRLYVLHEAQLLHMCYS